MKKSIKSLLLLALLMVAAVACKYDDGELWDKVNSLDDRLTSIETKLSQMNSDISSLSTIVNALQNKIYVTSVDEIENGYQITFTDGKTITITNGKDGSDAPVISVDEFEGKYYWVQIIGDDKSWLTDKNGVKIPVTGDDGITPILKVNTEGYWVISYDRGITFELLLDETNNPVKAVGKDGADGLDGVNGSNGDSFFSDVRVENGELILVLADGTELRLPLEVSNAENVMTVNGIINGIVDETLTVESVLGNAATQNNTFSIPVYDDMLPQLLTVTDENGNIIMMARKFYDSSEPIEINAQTTALALVTTNPLFSLIGKEHFSELEELILGATQYPTLLSEIEKSIAAGMDIYDTDNVDLIIALSNLLEDICGQNVMSDAQSRTTISNWSQLNINDPYPFIVEIEGTSMSITNTALSPSYKGTVTHPNIGSRQLDVPTREGYGGWELIQQASYGYNPDLFWADLGNGNPVTFNFTSEGEYQFEFFRDEANFYWNLVKDLFDEFGMPVLEDMAIKKVIDDVAGQLQVSGVLTFQPGQDPVDFLAGVGEYVVDVLQSDIFKTSEDGIKFYEKFPNGEKWLDRAGRALKYWSIIKGSSNALLRIGWRLKAPEKVEFCLCLYESQVTSCSTVELVKKESSDNQEGYAGQALLEPLEVLVKAHSEDGTLVETAYQKVKFEVISGGGSLSEKIVGTEGSYFVGTSWTLGDGGEQKVKAVAIDMITGQEISEPVYFTATLKEQADITVRLDWHKLSGDTDIDLHVTDPFGEEIYYAHMNSASGGWLDRDDVVGPGPEHVYWTQAPNGVYLVQVHYYGSESHAVTTYSVTINAGEETFGPYTGSIAYDQTVTIGALNMPDATMTRSATSVPTFVEMMEIDNTPKVYPKKK